MPRWTLLVPVALLALYIAYCWRDTFDPECMRGKRVVVTGASSGIGEQMAYHYARLGARLLITSRTEAKLQKVISGCREEGDTDGDYHYLVADMEHMESSKILIQTAIEKFGGIDYLVLNHILVVSLGEWTGSQMNLTLLDRILDVNLRAYVHLASHAMPHLEESRGSIVIMSSIAGKISQPYVSAYSASKYALDGFFSGLRQELQMRNSGISVTLCVIGFVGTENAVYQLRVFGVKAMLETLSPADPADTALAVIKGGASRAREIYYPYMQAKMTVMFRDWFPETLSAFIRSMYDKG